MYAYPMDSVVTYDDNGTPQFDRAVDSSQLRELHHALMTDGVLLKDSFNLQVSAVSNMDIVVNPGLCNIQGCIKKFSEETPITLANGNATMARIDTIVARLDLNSDYRDIGLFVIQGTPASVPTRPELTRNTSVYEIALADITVNANATSLTQANISDTRLDTNRCGIISSIAKFDTTKLYDQIEADLLQFQESNETEFAEWFEHMKEQLGEDAAGNLQLQIDAHTEKSVPSENGAHGFRFFEGRMQAHIYDEESMTLKWVTVPGSGIDYDGEKSVKGAIDECVRTLGYTVTSKNLLPYPYYNTTLQHSSVHFTDNGDGTVTINGTATGDAIFQLKHREYDYLTLKTDTYTVTGVPENSNGVQIRVLNSDGEIIAVDEGNGANLTINETENIGSYIFVASGTTVNNLVIKPMISKEGGEYEPYVADINTRLKNHDYLNIIDEITTTSICNSIHYAFIKNGAIHIGGFVKGGVSAGSNQVICKVPSKYFPKYEFLGKAGAYGNIVDKDRVVLLHITTEGDVKLWLNAQNTGNLIFEISYPLL